MACGGNAGNLPPADHDDELTSLSWLQDRNLLRGKDSPSIDTQDLKSIQKVLSSVTDLDTQRYHPMATIK